MLTSPTSVKFITTVWEGDTRKNKEAKSIHLTKGKVNGTRRSHHFTNRKFLKSPTHNDVRLTEFRKVTGYKVGMKIMIIFLCNNKKLSKKKENNPNCKSIK